MLFIYATINNASAAEEYSGYFDEMTQSTIKIDDPVKIYYEVHGNGYPLFLLHGGFQSSEDWLNVKDELSKNFKVIAVDSRGHGKSSYGSSPISYGIIADDLMALIIHLAGKGEFRLRNKVHVVGWSDGAVAAINLCIKNPRIVNKAVLFGVNVTYDGLTQGAKDLMKFPASFNVNWDDEKYSSVGWVPKSYVGSSRLCLRIC